MEKYLEDNYNLVQKEIFNITENLYKVKNKNRKKMSKIVENIKCFSNQLKPLEKSNDSHDNIFSKINKKKYESKNDKTKNINQLNTYLKSCYNKGSTISKERINTNNTNNTNYKKYQPIIYLYKNYKNNHKNINFNSPPNKNNNKTIDNCNNIAKNKFIYNRTQSNMKKNNNNKIFFKDSFNIRENNYNQIYNNNRANKTIDFNNDFSKSVRTEGNKKYNKSMNEHEIINFNKTINNNFNFKTKTKLLRESYWNIEHEKYIESIHNKDRDKIKNNIFFANFNRSSKNVYKKKINAFKENSSAYFANNHSKKKEIININDKYNKNKSFNKGEKVKKNILYNKKAMNNNKYDNNYNSNYINYLRITNNNSLLAKDKYFDIKNMEKIKEILNCENYEQCLIKIKEILQQKQFIYKILKIYNNYNKENENEKIEKGDNYENIILWIKDLIYTSQQNKKDNKYKILCKQLMEENNISNFSNFQDFSKNILNEKKNLNNFIEDIKKILSVDDYINKENNIQSINKKNIRKI